MTWGKMFMSAILAEGSVSSLLKLGKIDHLFRGSEVEPYEFLRTFVKDYGKLPTEGTIEAHTGESLVPHKEPAGYYFDLLKIRHVEGVVLKAMKGAQENLQPENKDPEKALQVLAKSVMDLMVERHAAQVADFRMAYDLVMGDYMLKKAKKDTFGVRLGWPYFDTMACGLVEGDVISFVGRPAAGKTWQMLYAAHYGWRHAGTKHDPENDQSRMFVSMEMPLLQIEQRLAALQTHLSMTNVKNAKLGTVGVTKLKAGLLEIQSYGAPFYVVDGNLTATVAEVEALARQLKPSAIFIDGGYLLQHPTERDRFKRVAENADLIKKRIASIAPTLVSWQFAKSASKKKKGEDATMDDIGYSDAIAQVSSIVLGIFEEETPETIKSRKVQVLKGRNGETGEFRTKWDFAQMNFDEIIDVAVDDLQFD